MYTGKVTYKADKPDSSKDAEFEALCKTYGVVSDGTGYDLERGERDLFFRGSKSRVFAMATGVGFLFEADAITIRKANG